MAKLACRYEMAKLSHLALQRMDLSDGLRTPILGSPLLPTRSLLCDAMLKKMFEGIYLCGRDIRVRF
jgi:hypothetical protein